MELSSTFSHLVTHDAITELIATSRVLAIVSLTVGASLLGNAVRNANVLVKIFRQT